MMTEKKKLHAYLMGGADTIIAASPEDAIAVWETYTGEDANDYFWIEDGEIWDLDKEEYDDHSIFFDWPLYDNCPIPPLARWKRDGQNTIIFTASLKAWILAHGRGFLSSTEY